MLGPDLTLASCLDGVLFAYAAYAAYKVLAQSTTGPKQSLKIPASTAAQKATSFI